MQRQRKTHNIAEFDSLGRDATIEFPVFALRVPAI